jgi:hypothetical protein
LFDQSGQWSFFNDKIYTVGTFRLRQSGTLFLSFYVFALYERKNIKQSIKEYLAAAGK